MGETASANGATGTQRHQRMLAVVGVLVALAMVAWGVTTVLRSNEEAEPGLTQSSWYTPLWPGSITSLSDTCTVGVCVADLVALPLGRPVETAIDLEMADTLGALAVERIWTGERSGIFGAGWESAWDIEVVEGRLTGPLPGLPLEPPGPSRFVELTGGSRIHLDGKGRVDEICLDGALCVTAERREGSLALRVDPLEVPGPDGGDQILEVNFTLAGGRATSVAAPDGRSVRYGYESGRLKTVNAGSRSTSYGYELGRLTSVVDDGTSRSFRYDEGGSIEATKDRDGGNWIVEALYGPADVGDPVVGPSTSGTETTNSQVTEGVQRGFEVTGPDGSVRTYWFNGGLLVEAMDAERGVLVERDLDNGTVRSERRPLDGIEMVRTRDGRMRVTEDRQGAPPRVAIMTMDERGRVSSTRSAEGTTEVSYASTSNRPEQVLANGTTTVFEYDERGLLLSTTDADGYRVEVERDYRGMPRTITDGLLSTTFSYDVAGRVVEERVGEAVATAEYQADGLLNSFTDRSGETLAVSHDASGRLTGLGTRSTDQVAAPSDGEPPTHEPPDEGGVDTTEQGDGTVQYRYPGGDSVLFDASGRPLEVVVGGRTTSRAYDDAGRLTSLTAPGGPTYAVSYTDAGRVRTVSDGEVSAELTWHGDLLRAVDMSTGTEYAFDYDSSGQLVEASVGALSWRYDYDDKGLVTRLRRPTGDTYFAWDDLGRPRSATNGAHRETYEWSAEGFDLNRVLVGGEAVVSLERDIVGHIVRSSSEGGESRFTLDREGRVVFYQLPGGREVEVGYHDDGNVSTVAYDGRTEHWNWRDGLVAEVTVEGDEDPYRFSWFAPGVLGEAVHGDELLVRATADPAGRLTTIENGKGDQLAQLVWNDGRLVEAEVGDWEFTAAFDPEGRPLDVAVNDDSAEWVYEEGALVRVLHGDRAVTWEQSDGRLTRSEHGRGDDQAWVTWDSTGGRPLEVSTSEGTADFTYDGATVEMITTNGHAVDVEYSADGDASASGDAGRLLADLFDDSGRFMRGDARAADGPASPWLDHLPADLGVVLPDVITGRDLVDGAISDALPEIPAPLVDDPGGLARRTSMQALSLGSSIAAPTSPDRTVLLTADPNDDDLGFDLMALPGVGVAEQVRAHLAPDEGVVGKVVDVAGSVLGSIGRGVAGGWNAVYGFFTETLFGQAALAVSFMAGSFVAAVVCGTMIVCIAGATVVGLLAEGFVETGEVDGLLGAMIDAALQPITDLRVGVRNRDPVAVVFAAVAVSGMLAGVLALPAARLLGPRVMAPVCGMRRLVCVSGSRFGEGAQHVIDAQRGGAPRVLRLDRGGAQARRTSALRDVPSRAGLDRDEYPFAVSSQRGGLSIRHIDPSSNRSLGAYVGAQLRALPDGARFLVLPIA
ncbi:MAG: hypothetical protein GX643_00085 [Acidimicrobiales bacterium]|nr:hypothetical protein [Acidimicrobiales bacterium]